MRNHSLTSACRQPHGVILIVVLVLVVMISLAGFTFMNRMATEYEATLIHGDLRQAHQTLASAETFLVYLAEQQAGQPEPYNQLLHNHGLFSSRIIRPVSGLEAASAPSRSSKPARLRWRFSVVNNLTDRPDQAGQESVIPEGSQFQGVRFGLQNESGKLHLGRVMLWENEMPGAGRTALMQCPGMTPEAADSVLDWIDSDDEPRQFGAEREYYSQLDQPYAPRNGIPESLEELLFVKGVTRDSLYGEGQRQEVESQANDAWTELFTLHSAEADQTRSGRDRIDLNDVYPSDYTGQESGHPAELSFLPAALVRYILLARLYGISYSADFVNDAEDFGPVTEPQTESSMAEIEMTDVEFLDLEDISSLADLIGTSVQLPRARGGHLLHSPLNSDTSEFLETMKQLEERVTVSSDDTLLGRINVNTAAEPVLRALIGDAQIASQIVEQRHMADPWERETTAWLLTRQILDLPTYRRIYPHITTRGAVHSGEIIVYREFGGPFLRRRLIIDASSQPARRVAWVDLTEDGLPVDLSALRSQRSEFADAVEFDGPSAGSGGMGHNLNRVVR
jgi:hypothetical protein